MLCQVKASDSIVDEREGKMGLNVNLLFLVVDSLTVDIYNIYMNLHILVLETI